MSLRNPVNALEKWFGNVPTVWALAIISGWCVLEFIWLGKYSLIVVGDNISVIPYYLAFTENGQEFADWTPFPAGGTDFVATGYFTLFYRSVNALLPSWLAYQLLATGPIVAAVLGTYGLGRRVLGLGQAAAMFAGFAYGILWSRELYFLTALPGYLPVTLLAISCLLDNKTDPKRWLAVVAAGILLSQTGFISRLVLWPAVYYVIWFLCVERRRKISDWAIVLLFSALLMAARWQDIVALLTHAPLSALSQFRGGGEAAQLASDIWKALTGTLGAKGYLPLILITGFGFFYRRSHQYRGPEIALSLAAFVVGLIAASAGKVILVDYFPFLAGYNITHIMQGFYLFAILAGGIAFQCVRDQQSTPAGPLGVRGKLYAILPFTAVVWLVWLNLGTKAEVSRAWVSWGNFHQNTRSPILRDLAGRISKEKSPVRAMSFQMHGSLLNSYGIETIEGYHPLTLRRYHSFWWKMTEKWREQPSWSEYYGNAELGSLTSLIPVQKKPQWRLGELLNFNMLSLANGGYVVSRDRLIDQELELIRGPDKSWSDLTTKEKILTSLEDNIRGRRHLYLYRNAGVFPRVFTVGKVRAFATDGALLDALGAADYQTLRETVFVEQALLPANLNHVTGLEPAKVSLAEYGAEKIVIDVEQSAHPSVLVITNSFSPYWMARVDSKSAATFPAYHSFWGVFLPAGAKRAIFEYRPPYSIN